MLGSVTVLTADDEGVTTVASVREDAPAMVLSAPCLNVSRVGGVT